MKPLVHYLTYFIFTLSALFFIFSAVIYYLFAVPLDSYELQTSASIAPGGIGFDVNNTALTFGSVAPGGTSLREISVANDYKFPIKVKVLSEGDMNYMLEYPIVTRVEPGQGASIPVTFIVPNNSSYGNYSGSVKFIVLRGK